MIENLYSIEIKEFVMTFRYKIKCNTCGRNILVRFGMGYTEYQECEFKCDQCSSDIKFSITAKPPQAIIDYLENCSYSDFQDSLFPDVNKKYLIKNFHQDFLSTKKDGFFYSVLELNKILEKRFSYSGSAEGVLVANFTFLEKNWRIVKQAWQMKNNNNNNFIEDVLKKYESITIEGVCGFEDILFDFNNTVLAPECLKYNKIAEKLVQEYKSKKSKRKEFLKLMEYYRDNLMVDHMEKFFNIYSDFFDLYNDFRPFLMYTNHKLDINLDINIANHNFHRTKMFYGNLYEAYTSNIIFISLLHNIHKGRRFDEFCNLTLSKYCGLDKSKKTENFKNTEMFIFFDDFLTNKLRNASHHGNIKMIDNDVLEYKSGKESLKRYTMHYGRYMQICVELFIRFVSLLQLEICFFYIFNKKIKSDLK